MEKMNRILGEDIYYSIPDEYAKGGKIGFDGLAKKVAKKYEGTSVPTRISRTVWKNIQ